MREHDGSDADEVRDFEPAALLRNEEQLVVDTEPTVVGSIRARKRMETEHVSEIVPRGSEDAHVERVAAAQGDTGRVETLPDGSVSIPILEEELVVTKRLVVRERVIVRKVTTTEHHRIEAELRRERLDLDADSGVEVEHEGSPNRDP